MRKLMYWKCQTVTIAANKTFIDEQMNDCSIHLCHIVRQSYQYTQYMLH